MSLLVAPWAIGQGALPEVDDPVIHYNSSEGLTDPVTQLQRDMAAGTRHLKFESKRGYLSSLLKTLHVPVSSQTLVFSKTSSQKEQTSPRTPRAVYFSSDVYVGWAPGCPVIDLASVDSKRGAVFYTLEQTANTSPTLKRQFDCLSCHDTARTLQVPGFFVRSVHTGPDGTPLATVRGFESGHGSSLDQRWAGWYVSGTHISAKVLSQGLVPGKGEGELHLGNVISSDRDHPEKVDARLGANLRDLRSHFDAPLYLSPQSDIVALLVLEHQVRMHNLLTRASYEAQYALAELAGKGKELGDVENLNVDSPWPQQRIAQAGERLLEYMLFRDEAPLKGPVKGTSSFAAEFQRIGPRASGGRSLRQLDLKTRLFRYPCSFLIYSSSFDGLPREMKNYVWRRLDQILKGDDWGGDSLVPAPDQTCASMSAEDRRAVRDILIETKPEFATFTRQQ
ncbi:MAG: hypothetical protein C5B50_23995 [Verrucomicrobia bacterium]|nr:MAG: hypothetical protein C5B50_23995 [Verrucomicrobiota bacterium]